MCNNNLPIGAENDPRAPWNIDYNLCRYCDRDVIKDTFVHNTYTEEQINNNEIEDDLIKEHISEYDLCSNCYEEEISDLDE